MSSDEDDRIRDNAEAVKRAGERKEKLLRKLKGKAISMGDEYLSILTKCILEDTHEWVTIKDVAYGQWKGDYEEGKLGCMFCGKKAAH